MSPLVEAHARLIRSLGDTSKLEHEIPAPPETEITSSFEQRRGVYLSLSMFEDGRMEIEVYGIPTMKDTGEFSGKWEDRRLYDILKEACDFIAHMPEADEWDDDSEYGYADASFLGTEKWEDQAQMAAIKKMKGVPDSWYLTKIVRFNGQKLFEMEEWLKLNCTHQYKRLGWASGCSTTVGIAFESTNDAFFYKMRWR